MKRTEAMAADSHRIRLETTSNLDDLTPREREVLGLIGSGLSTADIAAHLHRSQKTIKTHRLALGRKLKVSNRVELARIAIKTGLSPIPGWPGESIQALNEQLGLEIARRRSIETILMEIDAATQATSGDDYFLALVRHLATALQVRGAYVGLLVGESKSSIQTLAAWRDGASCENFEESLAGTVCEQVLLKGFFNVAADALRTFRLPSGYAKMPLRNVIGCAMTDRFGLPMGVLAVLHDQPIDERLRPESVLRILSGRANLELLRRMEVDSVSEINSGIKVDHPNRETHVAEISSDPTPSKQLPSDIGELEDTISRRRRELSDLEESLKAVRHTHDCIEVASKTLLEGLAAAPGESVFVTLASRLAELLSVNHVFICETVEGPEKTVQILATHTSGPFQAGDRYSLEGTPCELAISNGVCFFPSEVAKQFPNDEMLAKLAIECYFGIALTDASGQSIGVMNVLHDARIDDPTHVENSLKLFASRASAELERLRTEKRLLESVRFQDLIMEQVPGFVAYIDAEQRYQYVNDRYLQWIGLEREQVIGWTLEDILEDEAYQFSRPYVHEVLAGKRLTYERRVVRSDTGAAHWFSVNCAPDIDSDGSIRGALFLVMDITHEKMKSDETIDLEKTNGKQSHLHA